MISLIYGGRICVRVRAALDCFENSFIRVAGLHIDCVVVFNSGHHALDELEEKEEVLLYSKRLAFRCLQ